METEQKEQLIRIVSQVGNGAHIFAPKEWINEKVLIIRLEKKTIKEQILERLYPHLDKIIAVFLYGSHARNEATESSDLDVLVVSKEKIKLDKKENQDFLTLTEKEISGAIKTNPILMYSIFKEAKAIINQDYLEKLKEIKLDKSYFQDFISQTKDSIKSTHEIIELDKKTGKYSSDSSIYSLILRLRGVFIINCLIKNTPFSNSLFEKWLKPLEINYSKLYETYREVRNDKRGKDTTIPIEQEEKLIIFLEKQLNILEGKINDK
jgi:predicted nucleotidyltransferase